MKNTLTGKTAIITGGTRGIGRAIVERLLEEGLTVVFCGQSEGTVQAATGELSPQYPGKVFGKKCDVSQADEVHAFFAFALEKLKRIDILVNNAGVGHFAPVEELTAEQWHRMIDLNLSGVYYCCHEAIPQMKAAGGGYIINISSLAGKNPFAGGAGYNASKFGLNGFTEAMMLDHRKDDIRVSYIMPGSVDTQFSHGAAAAWKIAPEDIAEVVVMLVALPQRTLVSRVEIRPLKPGK
jgi:NAD(P)-dependent dehydrogenase (short-subunit alcohol dehydrogenase family)